jgi:radical SAM-linked protein
MRGDAGFPVRLRFEKRGKVRFVSHRDVARLFERAFRIEQLPLSFTQGFSPRPKVSFGLALGVGHESRAEYLDLELVQPIEIAPLAEALTCALPEGLTVSGASSLNERAPSLQEAVTSVEVDLDFESLDREHLADAVARAVAAETLPITTTRKGRQVEEDLRPSLRRLELVAEDTGRNTVHVEAATQPRGVRPADIITALRTLASDNGETDVGTDRVFRTHQWIERDGARLEPLEADRATRTTTSMRVMSKGRTDDRREDPGGDERPHREGEPAVSRRIA